MEKTLLGEFDFPSWRERCGAKGRKIGDFSPLRAASTDTRTLQPGDLFVALRGERFDGHAFLEQARARGARLALVDHEPQGGAPQGLGLVIVPDTLLALQDLAREVWRLGASRMETIALTGSNGKTTTKEIARALCAGRRRTYATPGNFNNQIGLPLTICAAPASSEVMIVEMGASKRGDILELIEIAPCSGRLITSIGYAHLEGMGGIEGVRLTKRELFIGADEETVCVVPDEEREVLLAEPDAAKARAHRTFGLGRGDVSARLVGQSERGIEVAIRGEVELRGLKLALYGEHNASNLAACLALLDAMGWEGLDSAYVNACLAQVEVPGGRFEVTRAGGHQVINDSYNANPSSVVASFEAFLSWCEAHSPSDGSQLPRAVVLGEMREIGTQSALWHAEVAERIAARGGIQALICLGPCSDLMAEAARSSGAPDLEVCAFEGVEGAASWLTRWRAGVIFLKASRSARLERLIEML